MGRGSVIYADGSGRPQPSRTLSQQRDEPEYIYNPRLRLLGVVIQKPVVLTTGVQAGTAGCLLSFVHPSCTL